MKTTFASKDTIKQDWYHVDANEQILGRLAVRIATVLMGKNKPSYTPNIDCGDYVVVTGAEGIKLSGSKGDKKLHRYHTGFVGGLKEQTYTKFMAEKPEEALKLAVRRMLPKGVLGRAMLDKLKIYSGSEHPHVAQNPQALAD